MTDSTGVVTHTTSFGDRLAVRVVDGDGAKLGRYVPVSVIEGPGGGVLIQAHGEGLGRAAAFRFATASDLVLAPQSGGRAAAASGLSGDLEIAIKSIDLGLAARDINRKPKRLQRIYTTADSIEGLRRGGTTIIGCVSYEEAAQLVADVEAAKEDSLNGVGVMWLGFGISTAVRFVPGVSKGTEYLWWRYLDPSPEDIAEVANRLRREFKSLNRDYPEFVGIRVDVRLDFSTYELFAPTAAACSSPSNSPPSIPRLFKSVPLGTPSVRPLELVNFDCTASDSDGDALTYAWDTNGGAFEGPTDGPIADWRAPAKPGRYSAACRVSDGKWGVTGKDFEYEVVPSGGKPLTTLPWFPVYGTVMQPYEQVFSVEGGTAPFSWVVSGGELPPGLALVLADDFGGSRVEFPRFDGPFCYAANAATCALSSNSIGVA